MPQKAGESHSETNIHPNDGIVIASRKFTLIPGGKCLSEEQRIKARIAGILREADESNLDLMAGLLIKTYERENKKKRKHVAFAVAATVAIYSVIVLVGWLYFSMK
jgi:hypothetical protein